MPCNLCPSGYLLDCIGTPIYLFRFMRDMSNGERDTTPWAHRPRLHIARSPSRLADQLTGFAVCHADKHIRPEENLFLWIFFDYRPPKTLSLRHSERRATAQKIHLPREEKDTPTNST